MCSLVSCLTMSKSQAIPGETMFPHGSSNSWDDAVQYITFSRMTNFVYKCHLTHMRMRLFDARCKPAMWDSMEERASDMLFSLVPF